MTLDSIYFFLKAIWTNWPRQFFGLALGRGCQVAIARVWNSQLAEHHPQSEADGVQVLTYSYCCLRTGIILPDRGIDPDKSFRLPADDPRGSRDKNSFYSPKAARYKILDLCLPRLTDGSILESKI
ncbi:hypothetical protein QT971_11130 [Microcoleus sp. herbarium19]|uniref:hypothetical protein n=1 Tax=Microcoleus sp. herbarium13 TaxID=3055438 RepID=UPI002FD7582B